MKIRRKIRIPVAAVLISTLLLMLLSVPFPVQGASLCFIAVNDTLLPAGKTAITVNGTNYVPYSAFTEYGLGLRWRLTENPVGGIIYNSEGLLFFNAEDGSVTDDDGNYYSAQAVIQNNVYYLPVSFVCAFFEGLSHSFIHSNTADIIRIKNSSALLTDSQMLQAAGEALESRVTDYNAAYGTGGSAEIEAEEPVSHVGVPVTVAFAGVPSETILNMLTRMGIKATFYLTAEEIAASADTVRRLLCTGHEVGINANASLIENAGESIADGMDADDTVADNPITNTSAHLSVGEVLTEVSGLLFETARERAEYAILTTDGAEDETAGTGKAPGNGNISETGEVLENLELSFTYACTECGIAPRQYDITANGADSESCDEAIEYLTPEGVTGATVLITLGEPSEQGSALLLLSFLHNEEFKVN